jgi:hypothetical protein
MVRLFNYLLWQKHIGSALVQLGGLEPPTSCSTVRLELPTGLRYNRREYENMSNFNLSSRHRPPCLLSNSRYGGC